MVLSEQNDITLRLCQKRRSTSPTYVRGSPLNFDSIVLNIYADCQLNSM